MAITTVLFDLDGTLLPMDQDRFIRDYFGRLAHYMAPYGYEKETLLQTIWASTAHMIRGSADKTNEVLFWEHMEKAYGKRIAADRCRFDAYYREEFPKVQKSCGFTPMAAEVIRLCKEKGLTVALATNPFFPEAATYQRIAWAGLAPEDFRLITTCENSHACKPNPAYYREILDKLGARPETCLMVGNDVEEDMLARELGLQVFLLTPCLINRKNGDISRYPHGDFPELLTYLHKTV